jgi:hypothetical protein
LPTALPQWSPTVHAPVTDKPAERTRTRCPRHTGPRNRRSRAIECANKSGFTAATKTEATRAFVVTEAESFRQGGVRVAEWIVTKARIGRDCRAASTRCQVAAGRKLSSASGLAAAGGVGFEGELDLITHPAEVEDLIEIIKRHLK